MDTAGRGSSGLEVEGCLVALVPSITYSTELVYVVVQPDKAAGIIISQTRPDQTRRTVLCSACGIEMISGHRVN